jgi:hypothetical protein
LRHGRRTVLLEVSLANRPVSLKTKMGPMAMVLGVGRGKKYARKNWFYAGEAIGGRWQIASLGAQLNGERPAGGPDDGFGRL